MQEFKDLDEHFLAAKNGNEAEYKLLLNLFTKRGMYIARGIAKTRGIFSFDFDEAYDEIQDLFLVCMDTYEYGKIPFTRYADFLLKRRLLTCIMKYGFKAVISLDEVISEDGTTRLDLIQSDDYERMMSAINEEDLVVLRDSYKEHNPFLVKPGITGLAQVKMKRYHDPKLKAQIDSEYV